MPILILLLAATAFAQDATSLRARTSQYLTELIRRDTTNPPGNETRVAEYLKSVTDAHGIRSELLGPDPARLNFIARIEGSGRQRPLLLMAHADVVPAEAAAWTVDPFGAAVRDGQIYGRGALDCKSLLAAELAALVELKVRGVRLNRDVILLAEADEESGSSGIQWMIQNAWDRINAEAALNEGGHVQNFASKRSVALVQTAEKIPTRVTLLAHGSAGHGSLPLSDNAILRLSRAILRLEATHPVHLNSTTRRYFAEISKLEDYAWIAPLLGKLENPRTQFDALAIIRARDPELEAQLHTSVSPTMLRAGFKVNVIPSTAEAQVDVRRLPDESAEEVIGRLRRFIHDDFVEVQPMKESEMPATEPSSTTGPIYRAIERVLARKAARTVVVPFMSRGATDGAYLRQKGMAVYGLPLFVREKEGGREHGNDERIAVSNLEAGAETLWQIILEIAQSQ